MKVRDLWALAMKQFRTHQLESLLIIVAVALGVGVVTAVAAFLDLGRQAEARFNATLASRELSLVEGRQRVSFPAGTDIRKVNGVTTGPVDFDLADLERAEEIAPSVAFAYAYDTRLLAQAGQFLDEGIRALGVTEGYLLATDAHVTSGSLFSASDFSEGRNVLLVTPEDLQGLELSGDPIGQSVTFDGLVDAPSYTIIGVLDESYESSLVPFTSHHANSYRGLPPEVTELHFAVDDRDELKEARAELEAFADRRWEGRVRVISHSFSARITAQQRTTGLIIATFASIGLAVASLNIMNLMLARVFKRSRPIGISRSLGATRGNIRNQFLSESLILGVLGGLVGTGLGFGLLSAYNRYIRVVSGEFSLSFSPVAMLIGLGVAVGISLLFGLYPALLASRIRPVEALREV